MTSGLIYERVVERDWWGLNWREPRRRGWTSVALWDNVSLDNNHVMKWYLSFFKCVFICFQAQHMLPYCAVWCRLVSRECTVWEWSIWRKTNVTKANQAAEKSLKAPYSSKKLQSSAFVTGSNSADITQLFDWFLVQMFLLSCFKKTDIFVLMSVVLQICL